LVNFLDNFNREALTNHNIIKFNKYLVMVSMKVIIRMVIVQHPITINRKRKYTICRIKDDHNNVSKGITKVIKVVMVLQIEVHHNNNNLIECQRWKRL